MIIQEIIPAVRDTVDDDYLGTCLLTNRDSLDVGFGSIVVKCENLITAKMSIEIGGTLFRS